MNTHAAAVPAALLTVCALSAHGAHAAPRDATPAHHAALTQSGVVSPDQARPDADRPDAIWPARAVRMPVAATRLVVFVHDQSNDEILRMVDLNYDGDAHDPGETTVFFDDSLPVTGVDNAQGMVALGASTLLATDNFAPDNIVYLEDANNDGDALDAGENSVWFDGALPGGFMSSNPADLVPRAAGGFWLLENNTLDTTVPEAIYILEDLNADNDVNDAGESVSWFELSPVGVSATTTFDVAEDNAGNVYTLDITDPNQIESIDIIDADSESRTEWLGSDTLFSIAGVVLGSSFELEHDPGTDEIIYGAVTLSSSQLIMAAKDINGSGSINTGAEVRIMWNESTHADGFNTGSPRDFHRTSDGRLLWTDGLNDRVMIHRDLNADGDFQDAGETAVYFDAATATSNGVPTLVLPLSISAFELCPADIDADGDADADDIAAFVALFVSAADTDIDGDGDEDADDIAAFVNAFVAGCP